MNDNSTYCNVSKLGNMFVMLKLYDGGLTDWLIILKEILATYVILSINNFTIKYKKWNISCHQRILVYTLYTNKTMGLAASGKSVRNNKTTNYLKTSSHRIIIQNVVCNSLCK